MIHTQNHTDYNWLYYVFIYMFTNWATACVQDCVCCLQNRTQIKKENVTSFPKPSGSFLVTAWPFWPVDEAVCLHGNQNMGLGLAKDFESLFLKTCMILDKFRLWISLSWYIYKHCPLYLHACMLNCFSRVLYIYLRINWWHNVKC